MRGEKGGGGRRRGSAANPLASYSTSSSDTTGLDLSWSSDPKPLLTEAAIRIPRPGLPGSEHVLVILELAVLVILDEGAHVLLLPARLIRFTTSEIVCMRVTFGGDPPLPGIRCCLLRN